MAFKKDANQPINLCQEVNICYCRLMGFWIKLCFIPWIHALGSTLGTPGNTTVNWTDFNFSMTLKSLAESRRPLWLMRAQTWKATLALPGKRAEPDTKTRSNLTPKLAPSLIYGEPVVWLSGVGEVAGEQTWYSDQICAAEPGWKFDSLPERKSGIRILPANAGAARRGRLLTEPVIEL